MWATAFAESIEKGAFQQAQEAAEALWIAALPDDAAVAALAPEPVPTIEVSQKDDDLFKEAKEAADALWTASLQENTTKVLHDDNDFQQARAAAESLWALSLEAAFAAQDDVVIVITEVEEANKPAPALPTRIEDVAAALPAEKQGQEESTPPKSASTPAASTGSSPKAKPAVMPKPKNIPPPSPTRKTPEKPSPAQTRPRARSKGQTDNCQVCQQAIHERDRVIATGKGFHKTCFRCAECFCALGKTGFGQIGHSVYCNV